MMVEFQEELARLRQWETRLKAQEATLLDRSTEQALLLAILRKLRERNWLKVTDLAEIEHAARLHATDDYRPTGRLASILRLTRLELEAKKKTPD